MNKLTVSGINDKCETINIRKRQSVDQIAFRTEIPSQVACKHLGVFLDQKMTFKRHVDYVTKTFVLYIQN